MAPFWGPRWRRGGEPRVELLEGLRMELLEGLLE
jgi:hypothetical protein